MTDSISDTVLLLAAEAISVKHANQLDTPETMTSGAVNVGESLQPVNRANLSLKMDSMSSLTLLLRQVQLRIQLGVQLAVQLGVQLRIQLGVQLGVQLISHL